MNRRRLELLLWCAAAAFALLAWRRVEGALPRVQAAAVEMAPARSLPSRPTAATVAAAAGAARRGNPFRLDRAPAPVPFTAAPIAGMPVPSLPPPAPPHAPLVLAGVVGPPWKALIEGIPGRSGAVMVRAGDRVEDLRVVSVTRQRAVIRGTDTTWTLTLKGTRP